ncbi:chemotaxis protein methyltransferase CheR [Salsuginibacillus halophilus]|uniref:protein-glutamate O-methyltransferase n=1 Tax=Salsuginibacillus halophilus TaxID=517424 RepID=A0A2P8HWE0_9BACI|nr:protein-glutamate O-methyltransferase CheR [Salsuginibacillus halophilus]PSL50494.1 chemotaxis protein methyltransferase CheR [Salsuginibacillus halophilus]
MADTSEEQDYLQFIQRVYAKTGIDLSLYKEAQMKRRLTSFYKKHGFQSFRDFFQEGLESSPELLSKFLERMTINVSEFYRNPQRWDVLENKIMPEIVQNNRQTKVWSAACSSGEEPYTLVMMMNKFFPLSAIQVDATDIDNSILDRARSGFYTDKSLKELGPNSIQTYFEKEASGYRVKDEVKQAVNFSRHNLLADNYGSGYDLIVCRNVLIYFTEEAKTHVYHEFCKALKPGGVLFVGSTEQIFNPEAYGFRTLDTFFYQKI